MQEVVLVIHLLLALAIIALVLIQRSSGGGLGIGGGGMGDFATARGAASVLTKATTICAFCFFATSLTLAVLAKGSSTTSGMLEDFAPAAITTPALPDAPEATAVPVVPETPEPPVSTE